ncbi:MAG: WD40 repeat domain-containing protein, partial [Acidobacteria bacterium]|nr:WD40 repeat domain-containing protein [Acidobacteriota bacterium]
AELTIAVSKEPLRAIRFTSTGLVVTGGADGRITFVDPARATVVASLRGHTAEVTGLDVSVDGTTLASVSRDRSLRLWDLATRTPKVVVRGPTEALAGVVYAPDGQRLVTPGFRSDEAGRVVGLLTVWAMRPGPAPDARVAGASGAQAPDADEPAPEFAKAIDFGEQPIAAAAFTPDGKRLLAATGGPALGIFQGATLVREAVLPLESAIDALVLSPDGKTVFAACRDGLVRAIDVGARASLPPFIGHTGAVSGIALRPDGARLATASRDGTVRLWDIGTRREIAIFRGHTGGVLAVAYSKDGTWIASAGEDGTVRIWTEPLPRPAGP